MTNLQKAAEQGNQAAPNLLEAIKAGEVGGGGGSATGFTIQYYAAWVPEDDAKVYTEDEAITAAQNIVAKWEEDNPSLSSLRFAAKLAFPKIAKPQSNDDYIYYYYVTQSAIDTWLEKVDWISSFVFRDSDDVPIPLIAEAKEIVEGLTPNTLFQADIEIVSVVIEFGSLGRIGYQPWPLLAMENILAQTQAFLSE